jgi:putative DNA primase/helicase
VKNWLAADIGRVIGKVKSTSRGKDREMDTPRPGKGGLPDIPWGDDFYAHVMAQRHPNELLHCKEWNRWLIWEGTHWASDRVGSIFDYVRNTLKWVQHYAIDKEEEELLKRASSRFSHTSMSRIEAIARTLNGFRRVPEDFDQHGWYLNCRNGTLDLRTGDLLPHDTSHMLTKCTETFYDRDALCPIWDQFLHRIMDGNQGLIEYLQRAVGYSLIGMVQEKVLMIPYGSGDNGKTTFIETLNSILGDGYATRLPSQTFLSKRDNAPTNDIADLKGVRFAYASEPDQNRRLDESLIKELTGGDMLKARFLYGQFFQFRPQCTLWLSTNHKPQARGTDNALWNRLKLIPFVVTIPREEQDIELRDKLVHEAPGILAWAVRGCLAWQAGGLAEPDEVAQATQEYRIENDVVGAFLDEVCEIKGDDNYYVKSSVLYDAYVKWCEENGEKAATQTRFSLSMKEKGYRRRKTNRANVWLCLTVHEPSTQGSRRHY